MRMVVLLPAPLGPSSPTISPRATVKEMPESAVRLPYRLVKLATSIMRLSFMDAVLASLAGTSAQRQQKRTGEPANRQATQAKLPSNARPISGKTGEGHV